MDSGQPLFYSPLAVHLNAPFFKKPPQYPWAGIGISSFLGWERCKIAEFWINSTQRDGISRISRNLRSPLDIPLEELINADTEQVLGTGIKTKPAFCKILGKEESQPQILHIGFNPKIKTIGRESFIEWVIEERKMVTKLKDEMVKLNLSLEQFEQYIEVYTDWVNTQIACDWLHMTLPDLPDFMNTISPSLFRKIRQNRANIVSVLNKIYLKPGLVIISPVGYIHCIVGSHQTHPIQGSEGKNEAWYIFSIGKNQDGTDRLLYFESQQTANTTYSLFDFSTPIVWKDGKPEMRKDLTKIRDISTTIPGTEEEAIPIIAEKTVKFESTRPEDFILNSKIRDITATFANVYLGQAESLVEGTYHLWPKDLFTLQRITLSGTKTNASSLILGPIKDVYHELIVIRGEALMIMETNATHIGQGCTVFIPACCQTPYKLESIGNAEVLRFYPAYSGDR